MQQSIIIALTAVLVTVSTSVLTGLFIYLWGRCSPTKADDPESLSRLLQLEQRRNELEAKHNDMALELQQQSDPERPTALSSSGGPIRLGAVSPGRDHRQLPAPPRGVGGE